MASVFADNFNRADAGLDTSANWSETVGTWAIVTNQLNGQAANSLCSTTATAHTALANVQVTVTQIDAAFDGGPTLRKHTTDATLTYYELDCYTANADLYRYITGTPTLHANAAITLAAASVIIFKAVGTGANVVFTGSSYNGGALTFADDTNAARIVAAGYCGLKTYNASDTFDNFDVDNTAAAGGLIRQSRVVNQSVKRASYI